MCHVLRNRSLCQLISFLARFVSLGRLGLYEQPVAKYSLVIGHRWPTTKHPPNMVSTTRVALVTGAARGIGRAIALRLADDGFDVAVNDLPNTPELNEVLREIQNKGRRSIALPADVSMEPEVVRIIQDVVENLGSLDVVSPLPTPSAKTC